MRIIAGNLGGQNFASPRGHKTHPMSDKMRGALFNVLGDIEGLSVLDAFSGTGALSFEAISRGAISVIAIDNDRNAQQAISENIVSLGLSKEVKLIRASATSWLDTSDMLFDLVLLDPPYDSLNIDLVENLADRVQINGVVVLSLPPTIVFTLPENFILLQNKSYGDATLAFWRRIS